ncbi:MAG TPA: EAL domain-containing protein [Steroidobacteraceae bacterium]|nr:EAL domain-containing protein [Steroidobacteraceae bacterium]
MLRADADLLEAGQPDDSAALSRRGLLIETVTASVRSIVTAPSLMAVLPEVLSQLINVVPVDRIDITEMLARPQALPVPKTLFSWQPPDSPALSLPPDAGEKFTHSAELQEWFRPLTLGQSSLTLQRTANEAVRASLAELRVMAMMMVPIMIDGRHWGHVAFADCRDEREWAPDDLKILMMLAEVIGAAVTRERFLGQAQQREKLLRAINDSAAQIMTATDLHQAIAASLGIVAGAIGVDRVLVQELLPRPGAPAGEEPRRALRNFWRAPGALLQLSELVRVLSQPSHPQVAAWMEPLKRGVAVQAQLSQSTGAVREMMQAFQSYAVLMVPIMVDARYWGYISLSNCSRERVWNGSEVDVLQTLAELIGTAITRERHLLALATANTIIQNSPTVLYRLRGEPALPMTYVSDNITLLGHDPVELVETPTRYREIIHAEDRAAVEEAISALLTREAPPSTIEFRMRTRDGAVRWVENRLTPVRDAEGRLIEIEGILADVTERKEAQDKIALLARTDALTGLANRITFGDRLRQAFAASQRGAHGFAVLYLDLDRFKEINDTLGHHTGDLLLQQVAARLQQATREIDVVARLGGDEFAIVQAELTDSASAGTLAEKLIELVSAPYSVDGNELRIGVSVGIALYMSDARSPDTLLVQADQALYRAKHAGRGLYRFYSDQIDHETRAQLSLAEGLRGAVARQELELRYQPQVELASGRIVGMEALLRWNHPTRGVLLPEDFLPIAEKFGIMQQVGRWTLDEACRQMARWRQQGISVPVVAINVALAQIRMGGEFVRDVMESLRRWGLKPADVELDVTELVLARSTLTQSGVLEELRQLGVGIAIDDFGAQYSSLDYLRTYRVNRLKIARGMIAAADVEPGGSAMIRAILSLARELDVEVVAEGIETEAQCRLLVQASASAQGQGFYYSQAVSAEESMSLLSAGVMLPPG